MIRPKATATNPDDREATGAEPRTAPEPPLILPMLPADLDAVFQIARASFPTPWTRAAFEEELKRSWAVVRVLRVSWGWPPCGFMNYWIVGDEIHLHNIAVLPDMRRRGYGRKLLQELLETAATQSVRSIWLEVRGSNRAAVNLYRSAGFVKVGLRPRYYSDNGEDALVMLRGL
jgi:ribosomal-protein-alanine N-acetyltransferase